MGDQPEKVALRLVQYGQSRVGLLQLSGALFDQLFQSQVLITKFLLQAFQMQMRLHSSFDLLDLERLGDIVNAADMKCLDFVRRIVQSTDKDHGDFC